MNAYHHHLQTCQYRNKSRSPAASTPSLTGYSHPPTAPRSTTGRNGLVGHTAIGQTKHVVSSDSLPRSRPLYKYPFNPFRATNTHQPVGGGGDRRAKASPRTPHSASQSSAATSRSPPTPACQDFPSSANLWTSKAAASHYWLRSGRPSRRYFPSARCHPHGRRFCCLLCRTILRLERSSYWLREQ